ncbi:hypothetical protein ACFLWN_03490 [Chloroflexota bacterium]
MGKLNNVLEVIGALTGTTQRHNRTLHKIKDLLEAIEDFRDRYQTSDDIFNHTGEAKVDVTSIMHHIRKSGPIAPSISGRKIRPLVTEIYDDFERVRVDVFNPQKGKFSLGLDLSKLSASVQLLADIVSGLEYK